MRTPRRILLASGYVALTVGVALRSLAGATLLTPSGLATLVMAPIAVVAVLLGVMGISAVYVSGLTDTDPDTYSDAWVYWVVAVAAAVNAGLYLWLFAR